MASDPVCGKRVEIEEAGSLGYVSQYRGQFYYFCCRRCKQEFEQDPRAYLA